MRRSTQCAAGLIALLASTVLADPAAPLEPRLGARKEAGAPTDRAAPAAAK